MSDSKIIGFSLKGVVTRQFAIIEDAFNDEEIVELNLNSGFVVHKDEHEVTNFFKVHFTQKKKPFLILETGCHFEISPEAWKEFYDEKKKTLKLPKSFAGHLLMLNIGTSRGVLHAKTEDTYFNQLILPPLNVNRLINDDVIIDLSMEDEGKRKK